MSKPEHIASFAETPGENGAPMRLVGHYGSLRLTLVPAAPERHNTSIKWLLFAEPRYAHEKPKPRRRPTLEDRLDGILGNVTAAELKQMLGFADDD